MLIGRGQPEGAVRADPGMTYWDKTNKAEWVKETGMDKTGWFQKFGPAEEE